MKGPTFTILGVPKAGTTTVHHVLGDHPDVALSDPKEPEFFEREYHLGPEHYWRTYFAHWNGQPSAGDARPTKLYLPFVAGRLAESFPDINLIAILRHPVERVFSHWWMRRCNGLEHRSLEEAIEHNLEAIEGGRTFAGAEGERAWLDYRADPASTPPVYLEVGYYARHIEDYLTRFDERQLQVMYFEDLVADPRAFFADLCAFIGVATDVELQIDSHLNAAGSPTTLWLHRLDRALGVPRVVPPSVRQAIGSISRRLRRRGRSPAPDPATRRWLLEHYAPHTRELEALTGRDLAAWRR